MNRCRRCGAMVRWVPAATTGKLVPLNHAPDPGGRLAVVAGKAIIVGGRVPLPRFHVHFYTCPHMEAFSAW